MTKKPSDKEHLDEAPGLIGKALGKAARGIGGLAAAGAQKGWDKAQTAWDRNPHVIADRSGKALTNWVSKIGRDWLSYSTAHGLQPTAENIRQFAEDTYGPEAAAALNKQGAPSGSSGGSSGGNAGAQAGGPNNGPWGPRPGAAGQSSSAGAQGQQQSGKQGQAAPAGGPQPQGAAGAANPQQPSSASQAQSQPQAAASTQGQPQAAAAPQKSADEAFDEFAKGVQEMLADQKAVMDDSVASPEARAAAKKRYSQMAAYATNIHELTRQTREAMADPNASEARKKGARRQFEQVALNATDWLQKQRAMGATTASAQTAAPTAPQPNNTSAAQPGPADAGASATQAQPQQQQQAQAQAQPQPQAQQAPPASSPGTQAAPKKAASPRFKPHPALDPRFTSSAKNRRRLGMGESLGDILEDELFDPAPFKAHFPQPKPLSTASKNYQDRTFSEIAREMGLVGTPEFSKRRVLGLVREIIAHARDHGGTDKERVLAFIKRLRKNPNYLKAVPDLASLTRVLETQVYGLATYLVENDIRDTAGIRRGYRMFFETDEQALSPNQQQAAFTKIARRFLRDPTILRASQKYDPEHVLQAMAKSGHSLGARSQGHAGATGAGAAGGASSASAAGAGSGSQSSGGTQKDIPIGVLNSVLKRLGLKDGELKPFVEDARKYTNPSDLLRDLSTMMGTDMGKKVACALIYAYAHGTSST